MGGASTDWEGSGVRQSRRPAKRPVAMAIRVAKCVGRKSVRAAAAMAMAMRVRFGARRALHGDDGLRDDGYGDELETMEGAKGDGSGEETCGRRRRRT